MIQLNIRPLFWQKYRLAELTTAEWEALCDGCGACCLIKLQDEDSDTVEYTDVACRLLDCATGACKNYANRRAYVPDCIGLTVQLLADLPWLPASCAYKRLYQGQDLPSWHYLITKDKAKTTEAMYRNNISVAGRCVSENDVNEIEQEERIIQWVEQ
ncbi:YcgN family cysteine cluster protein [Faucicola boevrei]|uniref:YcgN family cysteine cluster protein n=1 Tax=Faucicola boevrei TaxID=346665 RepID=UPI0003AA3794|nr:YcgN family cysteine cluster protein [Moraxella boevrei]